MFRGDEVIDARTHAPFKIAVLVRSGQEEGLCPDALLEGTHLDHSQVDDSATRTSVRQFVTACRNAIELGASPELPFRVGSQLHLSNYGLYGYAMLTRPSVREALRFMVRYHRLMTPTWRVTMHEEDGESVWRFRDVLGLKVDDPLYRFLLEMRLAAQKSLGADFFDEPPSLTLTQVRYSRPPHAELYERWLEHAAEFGGIENELRLNASALDAEVPLQHPNVVAIATEVSRQIVEEAQVTSPISRKVHELLLLQPGRFPGMNEVASALTTSPRTLRRHLAADGSSFQIILGDVRCRLAKRYLCETQMTGDDIASALGFSDAANFRHAFHKWVGQSPGEYRKQACPAQESPPAEAASSPSAG